MSFFAPICNLISTEYFFRRVSDSMSKNRTDFNSYLRKSMRFNDKCYHIYPNYTYNANIFPWIMSKTGDLIHFDKQCPLFKTVPGFRFPLRNKSHFKLKSYTCLVIFGFYKPGIRLYCTWKYLNTIHLTWNKYYFDCQCFHFLVKFLLAVKRFQEARNKDVLKT